MRVAGAERIGLLYFCQTIVIKNDIFSYVNVRRKALNST